MAIKQSTWYVHHMKILVFPGKLILIRLLISNLMLLVFSLRKKKEKL